MNKQICFFLLCLLVVKVSFSQLIEENRAFQFDKIVAQSIGDKGFLINIGLSYNPGSEQVYILKRTKDSFSVTSYASTVNNDISDVYSLLINDDTLFTKSIDAFYSDIQQRHSYKPYSKGELRGGRFFLTFYSNDKLQIFSNNMASQSQLTIIDFIINRLNGLSFVPFSGHNNRIKYFYVQNWNELLKHLSSGTVDSLPK